MRLFERRVILGYLLAVATSTLAFYVRHALDGVMPPGFPYLTFFPAVILTAFVAGLGPGLLCAVLCGLAAWWFFIPPIGFAITGASALTLVFYAFIVGVDITLIHVMQQALKNLRAEQALTAKLYDQQRIMFQELQHRVANNMTFVASLLQLKQRGATAEAAQALGEAQDRLITMSQVHRRLYDPTAMEISVEECLDALCQDLVHAVGAENVTWEVRAPDVRIDTPRLVTLSLLVAEVVTNALKHAFKDGHGGRILVSLEPVAGERNVVLRVADDGPGFPTGDVDAPPSRSLGFGIMHSLAAQLGGTLEFPSGEGGVVRLSFPASERRTAEPA